MPCRNEQKLYKKK
uniref:Uncharacterized protein n=1 Tax=Arundo donax TaxID=35708 RepID=A0A0A9HPM6_ARUDO